MKVRCFWHSKLSEKQYKPDYDARSANKTKKLDEVLKLDKISITYTKQSILDQILNRFSEKNITVKDIEIDINKGETIALVGESGSGKSTILKSIAGLLNTKNGAIYFKKILHFQVMLEIEQTVSYEQYN